MNAKTMGLGALLLLGIMVGGWALWANGTLASSDVAYAGPGSPLDASTKTALCIGPAAAPCSLVSYSILLANAGANMPRVSVFDPIPAGLQYVPASAQGGLRWDDAQNAMVWIGSLSSKSAVPLTFTVRSLVTTPITATNIVTICADLTASLCITRSVDVEIEPPPRPTPTATPTPPSGALDCASAQPMTLEQRFYRGSTRGSAANVNGYSCAAGWLESGPEFVYELDIDRPLTSLTISLQMAQQDLDLFILSACDPQTCIVGGDRTVTLERPRGSYYVVVDGRHHAVGDFVLELTWTPATTATPTASVTRPPVATISRTPTTIPSATLPPESTPTPSATRTPRPSQSPTATPTRLYQPVLPLIFFRYPRPPAPTATPTPSYPISLDAVWIEGPKGSANYNFRPCEVVYEFLRVSNYAKAPAQIMIDWIARDMSGKEAPGLSYRNAGPFTLLGEHRADIHLPGVLPPDATLGSYALTIRVSSLTALIAERTIYFSVSEEDPISSPLADLIFCRNVVDGWPAGPVGEDAFRSTDEAAYAWTWWQRTGAQQPHTLVWAWYRPDGRPYAFYEDRFIGNCTSIAWGWMKIAGTEAANWPGTWRLEIWLDGQRIGSRAFRILNVGGIGPGPASVGGGHESSPCALSACPPR